MNDIKIIKSFEGSEVLVDGVTETVKHEIKKNKTADFISTFSCFISATSNFFISKSYK